MVPPFCLRHVVYISSHLRYIQQSRGEVQRRTAARGCTRRYFTTVGLHDTIQNMHMVYQSQSQGPKALSCLTRSRRKQTSISNSDMLCNQPMHWVPHLWPIPYGGIQTFHSDLGIEFVCVHAASREMRSVNRSVTKAKTIVAISGRAWSFMHANSQTWRKPVIARILKAPLQLMSQSFFYLG